MSCPQINNLERVTAVLASVPERFVFMGGATICLLSWFRENKENLEEALLSFLSVSSVGREDLVIDLIEKFSQAV